MICYARQCVFTDDFAMLGVMLCGIVFTNHDIFIFLNIGKGWSHICKKVKLYRYWDL